MISQDEIPGVLSFGLLNKVLSQDKERKDSWPLPVRLFKCVDQAGVILDRGVCASVPMYIVQGRSLEADTLGKRGNTKYSLSS